MNPTSRDIFFSLEEEKTTTTTADDEAFDRSLLSFEQFDNRSSPDLWPDQIPGVSDFVDRQTANGSKGSKNEPSYTRYESADDDLLLRELGSLENVAALLERVRVLQNAAYELGLEEAKEMTRGKFLEILSKSQHS